jgi:hypothetical protein
VSRTRPDVLPRGFPRVCLGSERSGRDDHDGDPIGYESLYQPPKYESRGKNVYVVGQAYNRYFVVRACRWCSEVWWDEHVPFVAEVMTSA